MDKETQIPTVFDTEKASLGDIYAKALLGFGQKSGKTQELLKELSEVVSVVAKFPKLQAALESPQIPSEGKEKIIENALGGKVSKDLVNFLKIVGDKGRFDCLAQIDGSARRLFDELSDHVQAELTTAEPIEQSVVDKIVGQLEKELGKKVSVKTTVDPKIIGGMVIRIGDTVHDGSVANQLSQIRSRAVKGTSDAIRESIDRFTGA